MSDEALGPEPAVDQQKALAVALIIIGVGLIAYLPMVLGQPASSDQPTPQPSVNYSTSYTNFGDCGWMEVYVFDMNGAEYVEVTLVPALEYHQSLTWTIPNRPIPDTRKFVGHIYGSEFPTPGNDTHEIMNGDTLIISAVGENGEQVLEQHTFEDTGCP